MADCLFCKMVEGEIPVDRVYEDDAVLAFNDIDPKAPVHVLILPKEHRPSIAAYGKDDGEILAALTTAAKSIANDTGIAESGYRLLTNCGADAGQAVMHLHWHLLGGRKLGWPPG